MTPSSSGSIALDLLARNKHYRYGPHRQNRADLYVPRDGRGPYPVVVLIHGGYWRATYGKIVMKPLAADLVRRGYAAWNIEYRRLGRRQGGGWPMTFDDAAAAIDFLAGLEDERLDLGDVTLVGHSAGGQLALWAASRDDSAVGLARVIAQAPVANLSATDAARELMGGSPAQVPDRYEKVDPMLLVPPPVPTAVIHGADDMTIPVAHSREYVRTAVAAGGDVVLLEPSTCGHRSHIDPRSQAWRTAVEWLSGQRQASRPRRTAPPGAR